MRSDAAAERDGQVCRAKGWGRPSWRRHEEGAAGMARTGAATPAPRERERAVHAGMGQAARVRWEGWVWIGSGGALSGDAWGARVGCAAHATAGKCKGWWKQKGVCDCSGGRRCRQGGLLGWYVSSRVGWDQGARMPAWKSSRMDDKLGSKEGSRSQRKSARSGVGCVGGREARRLSVL